MYTPRAIYCIGWLIDNLEKGWNPDDPSMYGISQAWLDTNSHILNLTTGTLEDLSRDTAGFLYHWGFWQKYHLELLPRPMDLVMLCCLVHRETVAQRVFRECLGLVPSGKLNLSTLTTFGLRVVALSRDTSRLAQAVDGMSLWDGPEIKKFYTDFMLRMVDYYQNCADNMKAGYLNRLEKIKEAADKEVGL